LTDEVRLSLQYWQNEAEKLEHEKEKMEMRISELEAKNYGLSQANQQLKDSASKQLMALHRAFWLEKYEAHPSTIQLIDPIYEHLELDEELSQLYMTPLVQRLSRVRQLSFSYLDHPSAQHSRLAHSLGVCKNMELVINYVLRRNKLYTESKIEVLSKELSDVKMNGEKLEKIGKALALLHDVGHGPYGHALDRYIGFRLGIDIKGVDKFYSVEYIKKYLADIIDNTGLDSQQIIRILSSDKEKLTSFECFLGDLIDSPLDLDRLDYLVRDAYGTGLQLGFINSKLIIDYMIPYKDKRGNINLVFKKPAIDFLEYLLYARSIMYARCYEQDIKAAAEGMLILAVKEFLPEKVEERDVNDLMLLDDETLLNHLVFSQNNSANIAKLLKLGRVYDKVYEVHKKRSPTLQRYIEYEARKSLPTAQFIIPFEIWTRQIADGAKIKYEDEKWKILVVPPSPNVYKEVEADINILDEVADGFDLKLASEMSLTLEDVQRLVQESRHLVRVFVHPDFDQRTQAAIADSARALFEPPQ